MGLFSKKNKDEQLIKRLAGNAGGIIEMLKRVFTTERGVDIRLSLLYAAGLAGYACHQAVKAERGSFEQVTAKDGKKYYFGNDVNKYLLENHTSIYSFCNAICGISQEEIMDMAAGITSALGSENLTIWGMTPDSVYVQIKQCWDGIYHNMTARYCSSPSEWPVLYGIVLQNIMGQAMSAGAPKDEVGIMAMECALIIAKMDDDSI